MAVTATDVIQIYGQSNVDQWADVNNNESKPEIDQRIAWAISLAYATMEDRLRGGPYTIPFVTEPATIVDLVARLAGTLLYDSRGVVDAEDGKDALMIHRKRVETTINQIHAGKLKLDTTTVRRYPTVVTFD